MVFGVAVHYFKARFETAEWGIRRAIQETNYHLGALAGTHEKLADAVVILLNLSKWEVLVGVEKDTPTNPSTSVTPRDVVVLYLYLSILDVRL